MGVQMKGTGFDWITDAVALSAEIIHLICIGLSYFFQPLSPSSAWPSLTVAAALLTSPFPFIPSTVLNFRVTEIGQAVRWSLCQIEVKFEAEVSQSWAQSLQLLQRGIYRRALFTHRTVFRLLSVCQGEAVLFFHCFRLVPTFRVFCWDRNGVWLMICHLLYGPVTSKRGETRKHLLVLAICS